MANRLSRRIFLTASAASITLPSIVAKPANAQFFAPTLDFMITGNVLMLVANLLDQLTSYYSSQSDRDQTIQIANQLADISSKQDAILRELVNLRIVVREEVEKGFLTNEVLNLSGIAQRFKVALTGNPAALSSELNEIAGLATQKATALAGYGLAGLPGYLSAIALQNSVYHVLNAPRTTFRTINLAHWNALGHILKEPGPRTLTEAIEKNVDPKIKEIKLDSPLLDFGKKYPIWGTDTAEADYIIVRRYGALYSGFANGVALFNPYGEVFSTKKNDLYLPPAYSLPLVWVYPFTYEYADQRLVGPVQTQLFSNKFDRDTDNLPFVDKNYNPYVDQQVLDVIKQQRQTILKYYYDLYAPYKGATITRETTNFRPTEAQEKMRQLLEQGMAAVSKIWNANREL